MRLLFFLLACSVGFCQNPIDLMASYGLLYPTQVVGLKMWVAADYGCYTDAGSTLATNGQRVQRWVDRSGLGNDFGNVNTKKPMFVTNGFQGFSFPSLRFSNDTTFEAEWMTNVLETPLTIPFTLLAVWNLWMDRPSFSSTFFSSWGQDMSIQPRIASWANQNNWIWNSNEVWYEAKMTNWTQASFVYKGVGTYAHAYSKRKRVETSSYIQSWTNVLIGGTGSSGSPPQDGGSVTGPLEGYIAEIIIYSKELSEHERMGVEMYLKRKYALPDPF